MKSSTQLKALIRNLSKEKGVSAMKGKRNLKQAGFSSHKEMAEYMKVKGFEWNVYRNNYIKITGFKENEIDIKLQERDDEAIEESSVAECILEYSAFDLQRLTQNK